MPKPGLSQILALLVDENRASSTTSELHYKRFPKTDAYNGVTTEDLLLRGVNIINALLDELHEASEDNEVLLTLLTKEKEALIQYVKNGSSQVRVGERSYSLDIDETFKSNPGLRARDSADHKEYVSKAIHATDHYIGQMLNRIVPRLRQPGESNSAVLKRLAKIEIDYTSKKGRPTTVTEFTIPADVLPDTSPPATVFSVQTPIAYYTEAQIQALGKKAGQAPIEFIHTSKKRDTEGVANFVEENMGIISTDGPEVKSTILRGAWIPLDVKDTIKRRAIAERGLGQELEYLFNKNARENKYLNKQEPYEVNLASMSLLSMPGLLDALDPDHQLGIALDNHHVMQMLNGRVIEVNKRDEKNELVMENGKPVKCKIKVNITGMTMGVNFSRSERFSDPKQEQINTKGFNELWDRVEAYVETQPGASDELKGLFGKHDPQLKELENKIQVLLNGTLKFEYEALEKIQNKYEAALKSGDQDQISSLRKEYQQKMHRIEKISEEIHGLQKELLAKRQSLWDEARVEELLKEMKTSALYELLANFNDMHYMFRHNLYFANNPDDNYQFQMRYVIVNQIMDNPVHVACKSIEDRTGILCNKVVGYHAYKHIKPGSILRYYPEEKREKHNKAGKALDNTVNEFSASVENTGLNAPGSRGLQVRDKSPKLLGLLFNVPGDGNSYALQREHMLLAKREKVVYKKAMTFDMRLYDGLLALGKAIGIISSPIKPKDSIQGAKDEVIEGSNKRVAHTLTMSQPKKHFFLRRILKKRFKKKKKKKKTVGVHVKGLAAANDVLIEKRTEPVGKDDRDKHRVPTKTAKQEVDAKANKAQKSNESAKDDGPWYDIKL